MYILDQDQDLRSSPQPMAIELPTCNELSMSKKRKRGGMETSSTITDSLTALSSAYTPYPSLLTPAPSSPSAFTELQSLELPPLHLQHSQSNQSRQESQPSKRIQLSPRSRRPESTRRISSGYFVPSSAASGPVSACHVCHRRPTTMPDLTAYADCEVCHERTCLICMRTCEGPSCRGLENGNQMQEIGFGNGVGTQGRNICGSCCVEVGIDGRVWCLACYEDDENPEVYAVGMTKKELQVQSVGRIADWLSQCGEGEE